MPMQMCLKGHFYNPDIHPSCPTCAEDEALLTKKVADFHQSATEGPDKLARKTECPGAENQTITVRKTMFLGAAGNDDQEIAAQETAYLAGPKKDPEPHTRYISPHGDKKLGNNAREFPVAGWLVVIEGPGRGADFRLIQGENRIGRNSELEVALEFEGESDLTISREPHAIVVYDNHANEFFVERGGSRNMPMLNGKTIRNDQNLKAGDIFQIGETKLLFISLCGESFHW